MNETEFNSIFSSNLRYQLRKANMTQVELAEKLGVGTTSVYNWCNGIKTPRMSKVDAMCSIFSCKRSDLIIEYSDSDIDTQKLSAEEMEIALAYRKAPELTKDAAANVLGVKRKNVSF